MLLGLAASPVPAAEPWDTIAIVRVAENITQPRDVERLVATAAAQGITTLHIAAKQDEDDRLPSGCVFYASTVAPRCAGYRQFDVLALAVQAGARHKVAIWAWVPQFHDQAAARAHPGWAMQALVDGKVIPYRGANGGEWFINPLHADARAYQRRIVAEIAAHYGVAGVVLDWVRFDDWAMDLSATSRAAYRRQTGHPDPLGIDFTRASAARTAWNSWRQQAIGSHVAAVRRVLPKGMKLGVYILPPEFSEIGQDVRRFAAAVDVVLPMAYYDDWGYRLSWVADSLLPSVVRRTGRRKAIIPAFDLDWDEAVYRALSRRLRQDYPQVKALAFFVYGRWREADFRRVRTISRL